MGYFDRITEVLDAGATVIMVSTSEYERCYAGLKRWCKQEDGVLYRWTCIEGLLEMSTSFDTVMVVDERVSDLSQVLIEIERRQDSQEVELFIIEGIWDFVDTPEVKALIRKLTMDLPKSGGRKRVVLLSPVRELPTELMRLIPVLDLPLPDDAELAAQLTKVVQALSPGATVAPEIQKAMVDAAEGMTLEMATLAFKVAGLRTEFKSDAAGVVRSCKQFYLPPNS